MLIKKQKPAKLLLILVEYLGFSFLCGFISLLFFEWASKIITDNYTLATGINVSLATEYWIRMVSILASILIAAFVLIILVQKKFSYMIEISTAVLEMESGNLSKRIPIEGDDDLTDLAASINCLAQTIEEEFRISEEIRQEHFQTIATLSHDIRTPLTSVMSYLQFIQDGQYDNEAQLKAYAAKAYEKAYRIKDMTDTLFASCISALDNKHSLEKVEGMGFLKQAFFEIEDILHESGFIVSLTPPVTPNDFFLMIDKDKMPRIFDNIVSNIEKYADKKYPIEIQVEISNDVLVFRQTNTVISKDLKKDVESHLLGLKGVEKTITDIGGLLCIKEEHGIFTLEIRLPIC